MSLIVNNIVKSKTVNKASNRWREGAVPRAISKRILIRVPVRIKKEKRKYKAGQLSALASLSNDLEDFLKW